MKTSLTLFLICGFAVATYAQNLSGKITDVQGHPLEFANLVLLDRKDSSFIEGTVSDPTGSFAFLVKDSLDYLLRISNIGYTTRTLPCRAGDLGAIALQEEAVGLADIVIKGNRSFMKQEQDKLVFQVNRMKKIEGLKGTDILKYAPRVIVSPNGAISIGNKSAAVFVNDRQLSDEEAAAYLQNLNAKEIERIEVQQTHGAEKDAAIQGGVIHIITKTNGLGLSGNIGMSASFPQAAYYRYSPSARLYFGTSRWNLYGNYTYTQARANQYSETFNDYLYNRTSHASTGAYRSHQRRQLYRIGSMLTLTPKHSLGVEFNGTSNNPKNNYSLNDVVFTRADREKDAGRSETRYASHSDFYNLAIYYNWKIDSLNSFLKVLANYNNKHAYSKNELHTRYNEWKNMNVEERNLSSADGKNVSGNIDFQKNFSRSWSLRAGGKYLTSQRSSRLDTYDFLTDRRSASRWKYRENIAGGYIGLTKQFFKRLYIYLSLRAEHTDIQGDNQDSGKSHLRKRYTDWFPYLYLSHTVSDRFSYDLTYTKSIYRPSFALMNGYANRITDVLYDKGNPDLKPELTDLVTAAFHWGKHASSLTYRHAPEAITEFFEVIDDITYHTNVNYGSTSSVSLDYAYNGNLFPWWQTNLYASGTYTRIPQSYHKTRLWSGLFSWNNRWVFDKLGEFSFSFDANTPSITGNAYQKGACAMNLSFSRSFLEEALTIRIGVDDVWDSWKMNSHTRVPTLDYRFYAKNQTRQFWCSLTYSFSTHTKVSKNQLRNSNAIKNRL